MDIEELKKRLEIAPLVSTWLALKLKAIESNDPEKHVHPLFIEFMRMHDVVLEILCGMVLRGGEFVRSPEARELLYSVRGSIQRLREARIKLIEGGMFDCELIMVDIQKTLDQLEQ